MNTLVEVLKETPWWVYLILAACLKIGLSALQPKVVSIVKLGILPIFFTGLALHTLIISFQITTLSILILGGGIFIGFLVGVLLTFDHHYKVDHKNLLILIPGNWTTLILILVIFSSKYYSGYMLSANPQIVHNFNFMLIMLSLTGICTGLFIGRFTCYLYHFFTETSVNLKAIDSN